MRKAPSTRTALSVVFAGILWVAGLNPAFSLDETQSKIVIYTEDYKPLYFQDENGGIQGKLADLIREIAAAADVTFDLHIRPFKRGLNAVRNNADHCFLALWRTTMREPNFKWVGPLAVDGYGLFALKGTEITLSELSDSFGYATGAVSGWTSTVEVQDAGHPNLVIVYEDDLNVNMLKQGHTQLWLGGLVSTPFVAQQQGLEVQLLLTVKQVDLALACNPDIDQGVIDRLQSALLAHNSSTSTDRLTQ